MLQGITDYVKCAYHNKYTLRSYAALLGVGAIEFTKRYFDIPQLDVFLPLEAVASIYSAAALYLSHAGAATFQNYRTARERFRERGMVDLHAAVAYYHGGYCPRVGIELAAREQNLTIPSFEATQYEVLRETMREIAMSLFNGPRGGKPSSLDVFIIEINEEELHR